MRVRRLESRHLGAWNRFVAGRADATFFHRAEWSELLREIFGLSPHHLFAEDATGICGILPLAALRRGPLGSALVSTPACVRGGVIACSREAAAALEEFALEEARRLGVRTLEIRDGHAAIDGWHESDDFVSFRGALPSDPDACVSAIPRKQRAEVRRAERSGLVARFDVDAEAFHAVYSRSVHRLGTPAPSRRWFDALLRTFGAEASVLTVRVPDRAGGRPVASVLSFRHRDEVLPYYGGGLPDARALSAYPLLYAELMRQSVEAHGARVFDFGRSARDSGAFHFKRNFGFEPEPLPYRHRSISGGRSETMSPHDIRYRVFASVWRRLPFAVARVLGPRIAPWTL